MGVVRFTRDRKLLLVALALVAALVPTPTAWIERVYSRSFYLSLQNVLTTLSNRTSISLLDLAALLLLVGLAGWWIAGVRGAEPGRRLRRVLKLAGDTVAVAALIYLVFLTTWGLNYRRQPLTSSLAFDEARVTRDHLIALARETVAQVNLAYDPRREWPALSEIEQTLAPAFERTQGRFVPGLRTRTAVPGRPKRSLLGIYFSRAAIDGMTDPFFLEILVNTGLLPFERPFVVAHEWAHLAGYADESEANFVGWLTCLGGTDASRYSGWLFLYVQLAGDLPRQSLAEVASGLAPGPRRDLQRLAERHARETRPLVRRTSRLVYDRFLKANRVESGVESYGAVVTLILGTRFEPGWVPALRDNRTPQ